MTKRVDLTNAIMAGTPNEVKFFDFREPKFEDFMTLGDPRVPISAGVDQYILQPIPGVVKDYAERLLSNSNVNVLAGASLVDAYKIQKAILGFFADADQATKSEALAAT